MFAVKINAEIVIRFSKRLLWPIDKFVVIQKIFKNIPVFTRIMSKMLFKICKKCFFHKISNV